jgi:hypothetical protein
MIDPKELRIGNWIWSEVSEMELKVEANYFEMLEFDLKQKNSFYSPIPLTPEWLERLGFKPREDEGIDKMVLSLDSIKGGNNEIIAIREYNSKLYWAALISNGYWASNNVTNVHSLQNLFFALTGEEL